MTKEERLALLCVKSLGRKRVGGYGIIWGDQSSADLFGEWFTPNTEEMTSIFRATKSLPFLYNHGADDALKTSVIGVIDVLEQDEIGLWYEAQLDLSNKYKEAFLTLEAEKRLGSSSGTLPRARKVSKTGEILRWPIVEISGTPSPADPRHLSHRPLSTVKGFFSEAGLDFSKASSIVGQWETDEEAMQEKMKNTLLFDLWELELLSTVR